MFYSLIFHLFQSFPTEKSWVAKEINTQKQTLVLPAEKSYPISNSMKDQRPQNHSQMISKRSNFQGYATHKKEPFSSPVSTSIHTETPIFQFAKVRLFFVIPRKPKKKNHKLGNFFDICSLITL